MKYDVIFVLAGIILAVLAAYVITHDIYVYRDEVNERWEKRMFEDYMEHDCQALQDKIYEIETDDYWFNSPPTSLIKAKVIKCEDT